MSKPLPKNRDRAIKEIIRRNVRSKPTPERFEDLDDQQKYNVLKYIRENDIDIHFFARRGFDILRSRFFVEEYVDDYRFTNHDFDNFDDYYAFLSGDIYDRACYFGFRFPKETIDRYKIELSKVNFNSFTEKHITDDEFSFAHLEAVQEEKLSSGQKCSQQIKTWYKKLKPVSSMSAYEDAYRRFLASCSSADWNIFINLLIRKFPKEFKKIAISVLLLDSYRTSSVFPLLVSTYGKAFGEKIAQSFKERRIKSDLERIKSFLETYGDGKKAFESRRSGYSISTGLYFVTFGYRLENRFWHKENYYFTFDEMVEALDGNLSGCDLSHAPLSRGSLTKYPFDEATVFPFSHRLEKTEAIKRYDGKEFEVELRYYDENGAETHSVNERFDFFADFVSFLNKDLSGADLIMVEGLQHLPPGHGIDFQSARMRSEIAKIFGIEYRKIDIEKHVPRSFDETENYEIATLDAFLQTRSEDEDYNATIQYLSDLHLVHRILGCHAESDEDVIFVIRKIAAKLTECFRTASFLLGDLSSNAVLYKWFIQNIYWRSRVSNLFITLGNHELWPFGDKPLSQIVQSYRKLLSEHGMNLLHNNLYFKEVYGFTEITEEELSLISVSDLKERLKRSKLAIFGGLGFAGKNPKFNADLGIYMNALDRETEIAESRKFNALYEKVVEACSGRNLIIATHMPTKDWCENPRFESGFVYLNGHNHRNYYHDDGVTRIYADNQIGYKGKNVFWKKFGINLNYDWFKDYPDGIHEITREDYIDFYRGINEAVGFNRSFARLFFLKRSGCYMFLMETEKGRFQILNGGSVRNALGHDLQYFYDNMVNYAESVKLFLSQYVELEKSISREIKDLGGDGRIHGCIIDIDYNNHLYLNPIDGTITPYYALNMIDKTVYPNLLSLLKFCVPELYKKAVQSMEGGESRYSLVPVGTAVSKEQVWEPSTVMYKASRIIKGLQFTINYNIIRLWSDDLAEKPTEEVGRKIVSGILAPAFEEK